VLLKLDEPEPGRNRETAMKLAAVCYTSDMGSLVDDVLAQAARRLKRNGLKIAGSIQWNEPIAGRRRCRMTLEDLASGRKILASEDRGSEARGCHLDTSALEEAAVLAAASLEPGIDLVIVNRFGKQEIAGRGFRQVIEAAVLLGLPVLAGVSERNQSSWQAFAGDEAECLPASLDAVLSWCGSVRTKGRLVPLWQGGIQPPYSNSGHVQPVASHESCRLVRSEIDAVI
jgi:nucleoside-triphosphatase THEP1